jgi:hypothetical protein
MLGLPMAIHVGKARQYQPAVRALSLAVGGGLLGGQKRHYDAVGWVGGEGGSMFVCRGGRGDLGKLS